MQAAEKAFAQVRQPLSDMVELLYQQPVGGDVSGFLSGELRRGHPSGDGGITQLVAERNLVLEDSSRLQAEQEKLASEAQELRANSLLSEAQMGAEIKTLQERSQKIVKSLTQALVKLGVKLDKSGKPTAGCDPTRAHDDEFPNGLIPKAYLCPLQQRGDELRGTRRSRSSASTRRTGSGSASPCV